MEWHIYFESRVVQLFNHWENESSSFIYVFPLQLQLWLPWICSQFSNTAHQLSVFSLKTVLDISPMSHGICSMWQMFNKDPYKCLHANHDVLGLFLFEDKLAGYSIMWSISPNAIILSISLGMEIQFYVLQHFSMLLIIFILKHLMLQKLYLNYLFFSLNHYSCNAGHTCSAASSALLCFSLPSTSQILSHLEKLNQPHNYLPITGGCIGVSQKCMARVSFMLLVYQFMF